MIDITEVVAAGGGALGTVIIYLKLLAKRLDKIDHKIDIINGSVRDHEVRLAVLEDHDEAP